VGLRDWLQRLMPRGQLWGLYWDDTGRPWALRVDMDYAADPSRGWTIAEAGTFPLPRAWKPRRVVGWDDSGRIRSTVVARTDAPLWLGEVTEFLIEGSDQLDHIVHVTGRMEERRVDVVATA
jgi:hypothetical protein